MKQVSLVNKIIGISLSLSLLMCFFGGPKIAYRDLDMSTSESKPHSVKL